MFTRAIISKKEPLKANAIVGQVSPCWHDTGRAVQWGVGAGLAKSCAGLALGVARIEEVSIIALAEVG